MHQTAQKKVIFLTFVLICKYEGEWIAENDSLAYLDLLYNKFGDEMFKVDMKYEHCGPSEGMFTAWRRKTELIENKEREYGRYSNYCGFD